MAQPGAEVAQLDAEVPQPGAEVAQLDAEIPQPGAEVPQPATEVAQLDTEVAQPGAEVAQLDTEVAQLGTDVAQPALELAQLPSDLQKQIARAGKRPRTDTLHPLILGLCRHAPMSASELARLLGDRNPRHLRRIHLTPLTHDGALQLTIPQMPNHPDQRYTVPTDEPQ